MTAKISVVIPVKNMADHITNCVATIVDQLLPGDEIIVVDDGSTDDSAACASRSGALVMTNEGGQGPYAARNFAAARSAGDFLVFVDARSRARPGLIDAHRSLLAGQGVALSCTDVEIENRPSYSARIAAVQDAFRVKDRVTGGPLDFFPTANLGVHKSAFDAVSGFRAIRSGADADLCWRIRHGGFGNIAADRRPLMTWVPRDRLADLLEQNYRYGRSSVLLERMHAGLFDPSASAPSVRRSAPTTPNSDVYSHRDRAADLGAKLAYLTFRLGRVSGAMAYRTAVSDK